MLTYDGGTWLPRPTIMPDALTTTLDQLLDVTLASPTEGQSLRYVSGRWHNVDHNLNTLDNVSVGTPQPNEYLTWDGANWTNTTVVQGIGDLSNVTLSLTLVSGQALIWDGEAWVNRDPLDDISPTYIGSPGISISSNNIISLTIDDIPDWPTTTPSLDSIDDKLLINDGTWKRINLAQLRPIGILGTISDNDEFTVYDASTGHMQRATWATLKLGVPSGGGGGAGTTYTAGDGIDISGTNVISLSIRNLLTQNFVSRVNDYFVFWDSSVGAIGQLRKVTLAEVEDHIHLGNLGNVELANLQDGHYFVYDANNSRWHNATLPPSTGGGTFDIPSLTAITSLHNADAFGVADAQDANTVKQVTFGNLKSSVMLDDLGNVGVASAASGQVLGFNGTLWEAQSVVNYTGGDGIDITSSVVSVDIDGNIDGTIDTTDQTISAGDDKFLFYDSTDGLRAITLNQMRPGATHDAVHNDDEFNIWDSQATALKRIAWSNVKTTILLGDLLRVNVDSPNDGEVLAYQDSDDTWRASGVLSTLAGLTDTSIASPTAGQVLKYSSNSLWEAAANNDTVYTQGNGIVISNANVIFLNAAINDLSNVNVVDAPTINYVLTWSGAEWVARAAPGASGVGATSLDGLTDVIITSPMLGEILRYDGAHWIDAPVTEIVADIAIDDLNDVTFTQLANGQLLIYDATGSTLVTAADTSVSGGLRVHYNPVTAVDTWTMSVVHDAVAPSSSITADINTNHTTVTLGTTALPTLGDLRAFLSDPTQSASILAAHIQPVDAGQTFEGDVLETSPVLLDTNFAFVIAQWTNESLTGGTGIGIDANHVIALNAELANLTDVSVAAPSAGQVLKYNSSNLWEAATDSDTIYTQGTGIGISTVNVISLNAELANLTDVSATAPASGQVLKYDGSEWAPGADTDTDTTYEEGTGISIAGVTNVISLNASLNDLTDVTVPATPATDYVLTWSGAAWVPRIAPGASGTGATSLDGLTDVTLSAPTTWDIFRYDGGVWVNSPPSELAAQMRVDDLSDITLTNLASGQIIIYDGNGSTVATSSDATLTGGLRLHYNPVVAAEQWSVRVAHDVTIAVADSHISVDTDANHTIITFGGPNAPTFGDLRSFLSDPAREASILAARLQPVEAGQGFEGSGVLETSAVLLDTNFAFVLTKWANESLTAGTGIDIDANHVFTLDAALQDLNDVVLTNAATGQYLVRNTANDGWVNDSLPSIPVNLVDLTDVTLTTGIVAGNYLVRNSGNNGWTDEVPPTIPAGLSDLSDADISSPSSGQVLVYNSGDTAFENAALSSILIEGLGIDIATSTTNRITFALDAALDDLNNVSASSATTGQVLKYTVSGSSGSWGPADDDNDGTTYTAAANGGLVLSGTPATAFGLITSGVTAGQVLKYVDSATGWAAGADTDTTYTAAANGGLSLDGVAFSLLASGVGDGQVLKWDADGGVGGTGAWVAANDERGADGTTYSAAAGGGLVLSGTNNDQFGLITSGVSDGQIMKYVDATTGWAARDDGDTTYSAAANGGLALSGTEFSLDAALNQLNDVESGSPGAGQALVHTGPGEAVIRPITGTGGLRVQWDGTTPPDTGWRVRVVLPGSPSPGVDFDVIIDTAARRTSIRAHSIGTPTFAEIRTWMSDIANQVELLAGHLLLVDANAPIEGSATESTQVLLDTDFDFKFDVWEHRSLFLASLSDIAPTEPTDGQAIVWNSTSGLWEPADAGGTYTAGNGLALDDTEFSLADGSADGQIWKWNATGGSQSTGAWELGSDNNTTYSVAANGGLTLTGTAFKIIDGATAQQILKWSGSAWELGSDEGTTYTAAADGGLVLSENPANPGSPASQFGLITSGVGDGQVLKWDADGGPGGITGAWVAANDERGADGTTYSAASLGGLVLSGTDSDQFGLITSGVTDGQVLKYVDAATGWAARTDTDTTYSAAANGGLTLTGTAFKVMDGTAVDQILKWSGSAWGLGTDDDDDTTYSAAALGGLVLSGTNSNEFGLITSGVSDGQVMTYVDAATGWAAGTDMDTTYSAGDGLLLFNSIFSLNLFNNSNMVATINSDDEVVVLGRRGDRASSVNDFNLPSANGTPGGIWANETTMWVVDFADDKIYAYNISDKSRNASEDFDTLSANGNDSPRDIWSDGTTMWVIDSSADKIYAYNLGDKQANASLDFDSFPSALPSSQHGIASDGTTMWTTATGATTLYAYDLATRARDATMDITRDANNDDSGLLTCDGTTIWSMNQADDVAYAYDIATLTRNSALDFRGMTAAGNTQAYGMHVQGALMYVLDRGGQIYTYKNEPVRRMSVNDVLAGGTLVSIGDVSGTPAGGQVLKWSETSSIWETLDDDDTTYTAASGGGLVLSGSPATQFGLVTTGVSGGQVMTYVDSTTGWAARAATTYEAGDGLALSGSIFSLDLLGVHSVPHINNSDEVVAVGRMGDPEPVRNFGTLDFQNGSPRGIWSDGTTMWVADNEDDRIYAYTVATKARNSAEDFTALFLNGNNDAADIWSDGTTMWVADNVANNIFAYNLGDKQPNTAQNIDTGTTPTSPLSIASDGTTMWVATASSTLLYAFDLSTKARVPANDITKDTANTDGRFMAADNTTIWVSDRTDGILYAYDIATKVRVPSRDFTRLADNGVTDPNGVHVKDETMYVLDDPNQQIYAFKNAPLRRITFTDFVDSVARETILLDLQDVSGTPTDGQVLLWDNTASEWQPGDVVNALSILDDKSDLPEPTLALAGRLYTTKHPGNLYQVEQNDPERRTLGTALVLSTGGSTTRGLRLTYPIEYREMLWYITTRVNQSEDSISFALPRYGTVVSLTGNTLGALRTYLSSLDHAVSREHRIEPVSPTQEFEGGAVASDQLREAVFYYQAPGDSTPTVTWASWKGLLDASGDANWRGVRTLDPLVSTAVAGQFYFNDNRYGTSGHGQWRVVKDLDAGTTTNLQWTTVAAGDVAGLSTGFPAGFTWHGDIARRDLLDFANAETGDGYWIYTESRATAFDYITAYTVPVDLQDPGYSWKEYGATEVHPWCFLPLYGITENQARSVPATLEFVTGQAQFGSTSDAAYFEMDTGGQPMGSFGFDPDVAATAPDWFAGFRLAWEGSPIWGSHDQYFPPDFGWAWQSEKGDADAVGSYNEGTSTIAATNSIFMMHGGTWRFTWHAAFGTEIMIASLRKIETGTDATIFTTQGTQPLGYDTGNLRAYMTEQVTLDLDEGFYYWFMVGAKDSGGEGVMSAGANQSNRRWAGGMTIERLG